MICEKCWRDAWDFGYLGLTTQTDRYMQLIEERKDTPCPEDKVEEMLDQEWRTDEDDLDDISDPSLSQF